MLRSANSVVLYMTSDISSLSMALVHDSIFVISTVGDLNLELFSTLGDTYNIWSNLPTEPQEYKPTHAVHQNRFFLSHCDIAKIHHCEFKAKQKMASMSSIRRITQAAEIKQMHRTTSEIEEKNDKNQMIKGTKIAKTSSKLICNPQIQKTHTKVSNKFSAPSSDLHKVEGMTFNNYSLYSKMQECSGATFRTFSMHLQDCRVLIHKLCRQT